MDKIKEFFLKQIVVRIIYTASSFAVAHLIALMTMGPFQAMIEKASAYLLTVGIQFSLTLTVVDPHRLETWITGVLMIGAEFFLHAFHQNVVLPKVEAIEQQGENK